MDLRKQRCNLDSNLPRAREARLSYLLLCLEAAVHRGERSSVKAWFLSQCDIVFVPSVKGMLILSVDGSIGDLY